jgi:capsular polysaccharide biosynthesis protein
VNDPDQSLVWSNGIVEDPPDRLWRYDDPAAGQEAPEADPGTSFVNLGFLGAALKRKAWLWCSLALVGLLIGGAAMVKFPPAYQASTTVLVKDNPADLDPNDTMTTNATLAASNQVATQVLRKLGIREAPAGLIATATITAVTSQIVTIAVTAPTSAEAVSRASAWATAFLQFRANYLRSQQQQLASQTATEVKQAQKQLATITAQITEVTAEPASNEQKAMLNNLDAQSQAQSGIITNSLGAVATAQTTTTTMVDGSEILNPAVAAPRGHLKTALLYVGGGLVAGLALGMAIVIIGAITSDKLRRRDDVAGALAAPVRLSVGRRKREANTGRVVSHLRYVTPVHSHGTAGLAVVAVENAPLVAPMVVALAVSWAREGKKVVLADLAGGVLAKNLGIQTPGVSTVSVQGQKLTAVIPARDDIAPIGPAYRRTESPRPGEELLAACASADLLLTLATLDPAFGGEHLVTWATDAVAMVTAGKSSAVRIHAVGEMTKLSGTRLVSAVLLGADKDDESLGTAPTPDHAASLGIL